MLQKRNVEICFQTQTFKNYFSRFADGYGFVETDTLDTFFDSAWYYLRYLDPSNAQELVNRDVAKRRMPVDVYVGGIEHAAMHLFYARFIAYFLYDKGVLGDPEPFRQLISQGIVKGKTFVMADTGEYVHFSCVETDSNGKHFRLTPVTDFQPNSQTNSPERR